MSIFTDSERAFAQTISQLMYCNPFLPRRIELERQALGADFDPSNAAWNVHAESQGQHPNVDRLTHTAGSLVDAARQRLAEGARPGRDELTLYEDAVFYWLYHHYFEQSRALIHRLAERGRARAKIAFYGQYARSAERLLSIPGVKLPGGEPLPQLFAFIFQVRRAFFQIFTHIVGTSSAASRLRATVWESIFTHDMRRYRRALYCLMGDIPTLITGPSGTGKELVARAIGLSRYIPFDAKTESFTEDVVGSFYPLNLSALSPTLIESELFGHRRGAFTGALEDRAGWLEVCPPLGTVFLDEIGELDGQIQVKLLRVLQTRAFSRIGDREQRAFRGKVIAATNRDIGAEMRAGRFREDLYYRLCADIVRTPSLHEQLRESEAELRQLVRFIAQRVVPEAEEAESLADEVEEWVRNRLGPEYPWPGNFRELEQCVRNVLIRKEYVPAGLGARDGSADLAAALAGGELTADQLLRRYCTLIYAQTGSYEQTAKRLGLDRRTVKAKVQAGSTDGRAP